MIKAYHVNFLETHVVGQLHINVGDGASDPEASGDVNTEIGEARILAIVRQNVEKDVVGMI